MQAKHTEALGETFTPLGAEAERVKQRTAQHRGGPPLAEPVVISQFWKDHCGEAVTRLLTYEGQNIVDIRTWHTRDGNLQPSKGFACAVKHLPKLVALLAATRKTEEAGLLAASAIGAHRGRRGYAPDEPDLDLEAGA